MAYDSLMVFTGNANPRLAADVVRRLNISLGRATVGRFSDGEINVELLENVRGKDVFVLQPTCSPTNDSVMELLTRKKLSDGGPYGVSTLISRTSSRSE